MIKRKVVANQESLRRFPGDAETLNAGRPNHTETSSEGEANADRTAAPAAAAGQARPARLALEYITLDDRLQSRELKPAVVDDYLSAMRRGEEFPPVVLVRDGRDRYYLVDGYHRVAAASQRAGIDSIPVKIVEGTLTDALWLSWGANRDHGLRRSQKDKRRAVLAVLRHSQWSKKSDRAIARHIGCDHKTVAALRRRVAAGEFPTQEAGSLGVAGPSKRVILRACRLLAAVQPEQAAQFDDAERGMVGTAYESLRRLLGGTEIVNAGRPNNTEKISEGEANGNYRQN